MTRKRNKNISEGYQSDDEGASSNGQASTAAANLMNNSLMENLKRLDEAGRLPKLVAFDLDYTLWPLWVDTHVDTPIKQKGNSLNKAIDRYGTTMSFFPHVPSILFYLRSKGVVIAAASRTSAPSAARQALQSLILVDETSSNKNTNQQQIKSISLFNQQEIYPGSKLTHFKSLHSKTGIPYEEMLFFDDEHRNAEVGKLGVHFQLVGHSGTDLATFERGVREWRAKAKAREGDLNAGADLMH